MGRIRVDGKFFSLDRSRFQFRGVTYGTFAARETDGELFPERHRVKDDFASIGAAGFTVARTYTSPPDDVIRAAEDTALRILAGVFFSDWRYLVGSSRRQAATIQRQARAIVARESARLAGAESVLGVCIGNEIPADVVRWLGTDRMASWVGELADAAHQAAPELLVTYANYPTAEYLDLAGLDFLTFNVFLESKLEFRRYLTRLHHLAGDRPVVLGEMGLHAGEGVDGARRQAEVIDWQLETALERGVAGTCIFSWTDEWAVGGHDVEGWRFGLTDSQRRPRPGLGIATAWNSRGVADLPVNWPSISVVICAYNAAETLDECLSHTCRLDYPNLEILVIDDGSTDSTADIARKHHRARLVTIPHGGLSVARNAGMAEATGDLIAYLDSDAYPAQEWPYYLVLGMDAPMVGGAGGPNVPPRSDPRGAQQVAQAPGGPVHVLTADDRAEHVPGCNMAFWKPVLEEVGGFDPIYTAAGDDVDVCWKVLDRGYEIGFHPAALVWHHRRPGFRRYLRQQIGYGRAEALVAARHPDRFNPLGSARWRGSIYGPLPPALARHRIYRGLYGSAAYQSVYRDGGHVGDILHQAGIPLAALFFVLSLPFLVVNPMVAIVPSVTIGFVVALFGIDVARTHLPRHLRKGGRLGFRTGVALMHIAQPLVRTWARMRHGALARRELPALGGELGPATRAGRVVILPAWRERALIVADLITLLRRAGYRVVPPTGWEDYDARLLISTFFVSHLITTAFPEGCIQARLGRLRSRRWWMALAGVAFVIGGLGWWPLSVVVAAGVVTDGAIAVARQGRVLARVALRGSTPPSSPTGPTPTG